MKTVSVYGFVLLVFGLAMLLCGQIAYPQITKIYTTNASGTASDSLRTGIGADANGWTTHQKSSLLKWFDFQVLNDTSDASVKIFIAFENDTTNANRQAIGGGESSQPLAKMNVNKIRVRSKSGVSVPYRFTGD